jgi:hypothetical protein
MHAYCLIGTPPATLTTTLIELGIITSHHPADTFMVETNEKGNISIKSIRDLIRFFATPPQGDQKIGYLPQAESLSLPAAQALLKTLEEPPPYALIVLVSATTESLLSTILSRCQIIYTQTPSSVSVTKTTTTLLEELESTTPANRCLLISSYTTKRDKALDWCRQATSYYRLLLQQQPRAAVLHNLKQLETAYLRLQANTHVALTLETACLNLRKV